MARLKAILRTSISIIIILAVSFCQLPPSVDAAAVKAAVRFNDLQYHWAQSQINRLNLLGMIKGYRDRTFRPDQPVSRLEAMVLIIQSAGYTPETKRQTPSGQKTGKTASGSINTATVKVPWGQPYMDLALDKGFLPNPGRDGFDYNGPSTRLEIAKLLARVLCLVAPATAATINPQQTAEIATKNPVVIAFSDEYLVPEADLPLLRSVLDAGIMSGYPNGFFAPYQTVTRAELSVIISRLMDLGWAKTTAGQQITGKISQVIITRKTREIELVSSSTSKKYKLSKLVQCYNNNIEYPVNRAAGYRCEIILDSSKMVSWINLLEKPEPLSKTKNKIRGSVKSLLLGKDNILVVNDLGSRDHLLPIAWDAIIEDQKATKDLKALKTGVFVDLEIDREKVKRITLLEVKTLSDTVESIDGRLSLKSAKKISNAKTSSKSKSKTAKTANPKTLWFNHWDMARIIDNDGTPISNVLEGDKVEVTYLDPYPQEIDDEIPLQIKITTRKK